MSAYLTSLVTRAIEPVTSLRPKLPPLFGSVSRDQQEPVSAQVEESNIKEARVDEVPTDLPVPKQSPIGENAPRFAPTYSIEKKRQSDESQSKEQPYQEERTPRQNADGSANPIIFRAKAVDEIQVDDPVARDGFAEGPVHEVPNQRPSEKTATPQYREVIVQREPGTELEYGNASLPRRPCLPSAAEVETRPADPVKASRTESENISNDSSLTTQLEALRLDIRRFRTQIAPPPVSPRIEREPPAPSGKPSKVTPAARHEPQAERGRPDFETPILLPRQKEWTLERLPEQPQPTVHVTIGKIEIRAEPTPQPTRKTAASATAPLSLSEYLRRRSARSRE